MGNSDEFFEDFEDVDDWNMGHWVSAVLTVIFWVFVAYMLYWCCCRRRKNQGTVFTTVQAVPAQTATTVQHGSVIHTTVTPSAAVIARAAPYPVQQAAVVGGPTTVPYPTTMNQSYPHPQPYQMPHQSLYPPAAGQPGVPYPAGMPQPYGAVGAPYTQNPPSYDQVVGQEGYQKQAPYNPTFPGN